MVEPVTMLLPAMVAPAFHSVPEHDETWGAEAAGIAELAGLTLDAEQCLILDAMYARRNGRLAARDVGIVVSRQNLKTVCLQAAALADLFLFDDQLIVWTAHLFDTAQEAFRDIVNLIDGSADLSRQVRTIHRARGDEGVELRNGARLAFMARSKNAGRGLSGDKVILDEAFALNAAEMGALLPTLSARPEPQVRYASSAGKLESSVLRAIRDRGRAGGDPSLAYLEWCAPTGGCLAEDCQHLLGTEGCALDDESLWQQANPALGRRIGLDDIRAERRSLIPVEFARERLGWWEDPPNLTGALIDAEVWTALADPQVDRGDAPTFGLDLDRERLATIAVVWTRDDGGVQAMLAAERVPAHEAAATCADLTSRWNGRLVIGGAGLGLEPDLQRLGVPLTVIKPAEFPGACGSVMDRVTAGTLHHGNQPALNTAVANARWRVRGTADEREFDLTRSIGIGPLAAVTRAMHGHETGIDITENFW